MSGETKYSFDSASFHVDSDVDRYIRERHLVALDLGRSVYLDSQKTVAIITELIQDKLYPTSSKTNDESLEERDERIVGLETNNKRLVDDLARSRSQLNLISSNFQSAKMTLEENSTMIVALRSENTQLKATLSKPQIVYCDPNDMVARKLDQRSGLSELELMRSQHIEAITSLKVLEEENCQLRQELDNLKQNAKPGTKVWA